jgi:hypothetical protein
VAALLRLCYAAAVAAMKAAWLVRRLLLLALADHHRHHLQMQLSAQAGSLDCHCSRQQQQQIMRLAAGVWLLVGLVVPKVPASYLALHCSCHLARQVHSSWGLHGHQGVLFAL